MGRGRRGLVPAAASGPKERHKRSQRFQYHHPFSPPPDTFKAKPSLPKSKHHSYFELVENKEKKKKLEYQVSFVGATYKPSMLVSSGSGEEMLIFVRRLPPKRPRHQGSNLFPSAIHS